MGGKQIFLRIKQSITYRRGKEITAYITDYKTASFSKGGNTRIRYAVEITYSDGGESKSFTTDYLYDVNEFKYLKELVTIKVKIDKNFVTICEPFPNEIYKVDSNYGIELEFYRQKPVLYLLFIFRLLSRWRFILLNGLCARNKRITIFRMRHALIIRLVSPCNFLSVFFKIF